MERIIESQKLSQKNRRIIVSSPSSFFLLFSDAFLYLIYLKKFIWISHTAYVVIVKYILCLDIVFFNFLYFQMFFILIPKTISLTVYLLFTTPEKYFICTGLQSSGLKWKQSRDVYDHMLAIVLKDKENFQTVSLGFSLSLSPLSFFNLILFFCLVFCNC